MCEPCPRGNYSTSPVSNNCIFCPEGQSTKLNGADTIDLCDGERFLLLQLVHYYLYMNISTLYLAFEKYNMIMHLEYQKKNMHENKQITGLFDISELVKKVCT